MASNPSKTITFDELLQFLNNSDVSLNPERLNEIKNGKTAEQQAAIDRAAHIRFTDAAAIEMFVREARSIGWNTTFKEHGAVNGQTSQQLSIVFTPDNMDKDSGVKPFELKFSADQNGHIIVNGMPSINTLVAGITDEGDLTLSTAQSAMFRKMATLIRNEKNKQSLGRSQTAQDRINMMKWLVNTARKDTLTSSSSYKQNKEIAELINETMGVKGSNPNRRAAQLGDINANNLIKQIVNTNLQLFTNHFRNHDKDLFLTESLKERYISKAETDIATILQLYAILGPDEAKQYLKNDFKYLYNNNQMRQLIDKVGTQVNSLGINQAHLSDTHAMRMLGLNKPMVAGHDFFLESQRKTMQTLLTHTPMHMVKGNQKKGPLKGAMFENALKKNSNLDFSYGDFDLEGRAMVDEKSVKQGFEAFRHYMYTQHKLTQKQFNEKYGAIAPTVTEDALLYNGGIGRKFDPFIPKTTKVSAQEFKEYFDKKGWNYQDILAGKNATKKITSAQAIKYALKAVSDYGDKEISAKDLAYNVDSILDAINNGGFFDIAYRIKAPFKEGKFVTPGATYREYAAAVDPRVLAYIQQAAGYKLNQIFEGYDPAKHGNNIEDVLRHLEAGDVKLHANFAFNRSSGTSVAGQNGIKIEAKSLGDYFTGLTNEVVYSYVMSGIETARKNKDSRPDEVLKAELQQQWIDTAVKKIEDINKELEKTTGNKKIISANKKLINKLQNNKIFEVNKETGKIDWYNTNTSKGEGFDVGKDYFTWMQVMGKMYEDMYGVNPINIINTKEGRGIEVAKNIMLRQQEMVHLSSIYGKADRENSGYELAQGYREAAATKRLIAFVNAMGYKATNDVGEERNITDWAEEYVDKMFSEKTYWAQKYNDPQEAERRLKEAKRVANTAFDMGLTPDVINKMEATDPEHRKSMILDMEDAIWANLEKTIKYDEQTGRVEASSFDKSFLGVLETEIKKFIAREYTQEVGLLSTQDWAKINLEDADIRKLIPRLFLKTPNGMVAQSRNSNGQIATGAYLPLYYNEAEYDKNSNTYSMLPEQLSMMRLLSAFREIAETGAFGSIYSSSLGASYSEYLRDLENDFSKEGTSYERGNRADIAHAVMPSLKSMTLYANNTEGLENALFLSEEDVRKMLTPSEEDKKEYKGRIEEWTNDVLMPIYNDIYMGKDGVLIQEGQEFLTTIKNQIKGNKLEGKDAAIYRENQIRDKIIKAMTVGSQEYRATGHRGTIAALNRYPSSMGRDIKAAKLFIDSGMNAGQLAATQELFRVIHADFDGDHGVARLWFADGTVISKHFSGDKNENVRAGIMKTGRLAAEQQAFANKIYDVLAKRGEDINKKNSGVKNKDTKNEVEGLFTTQAEVDKLTDRETEYKRTFLSKYNKTLTGSSSNLYQAVERLMYERGIDDASSTALDNGQALTSAIVRGMLQSFTENAISAKKVEYKEKGMGAWWNEASTILEELKKGENWQDLTEGGKLHNILRKMINLGVLKESDKNGGGIFDTWITSNIMPLVSRSLKTATGRSTVLKLFGGESNKKLVTALKKYEKGFKNDESFEKQFLKDVADGIFNFTLDTVMEATRDTNMNLKERGVTGGIAHAVSNRYKYLPGVGSVLKEYALQNNFVPDDNYIKMLNRAGLYVDDKGVIYRAGDTTADERNQAYFERQVQEFTNKQKDLTDFAKDWNNGGRNAQQDQFWNLAERVQREGSAYRTSASKMKELLFPTGEPKLPYDQFNETWTNLLKEGKNIDAEGVKENLGFEQSTFNLLRANQKSTAIGNYAHARAALLFSALQSGIEGYNEDYFNSFLAIYKQEIENEIKSRKENNGKLAPKTKAFGGRGSKDFKAWDSFKNEIIDYYTSNQTLENYLNFFETDTDRRNKERALADLRANAITNYLTTGDNGVNAKNIIAAEGNLLGAHRGAIDASRADLMYTGDKALYVMDYKNTKGGKATADQVYQVLHYLNDIEQLRTVLDGMDLDKVAKGKWEDNAILDLYKDKSFGGEKYFTEDEKPTAAWERLVAAAGNKDLKLKGRILSTDQEGILRDYLIDYYAPGVSGILAKAEAGMAFNEEDIRGLTDKGILKENFEYKIDDYVSITEDNKNLAEYLKLITEITSYTRELYKLQLQLRQAQKEGNEAEIANLTKIIKDKETEFNLVNKVADAKRLEKEIAAASPEAWAQRVAKGEDLAGALEDEQRWENANDERIANKEHEKSYKQLKSLINQRTKLKAGLYQNQVQYDMTTGDPARMALEEQREVMQEQMNQIAENIQAVLNDPYMTSSVRERLQNDLEQLEGEAVINLNRRITNLNVQNRGQNTLWGQLGLQFNNMLQRFIKWGAASRIIQTIRRDIQKLVQSASQLDKAITNLRIVTGKNDDEASKLVTSYSNLARSLGATTTEVANSANEWLRQGYAMNEVTELVTASMYLSKLGMISSEEATKDMTSALKAFKIEAMDAMSVVDKFTSIDINAATTAGEIATALQSFGVTASMNGLSIDQASAMAATIMDVSQVGASSAGNALKTILSRYGNVKAGAYTGMNPNYDNDETTQNINDIERVLNNIGISIRDTNLEFREFDEVLSDLADKWITLDTVTQNAVATAFAGVRQRESFSVLINNMDKYNELLEVSQTSQGTAERKYEAYYESLEAYQKRLQAAWEELANNANIRDFMKGVTGFVTFLVKNLPTIFRYLTTFVTSTQGYKIPRILSSMGKFMNPFGVTARQQIKQDGLLKGVSNSLLGKYKNEDIKKYYGFRGNSTDTLTTSISSATSSLKENTIAIERNSAIMSSRNNVPTNANNNVATGVGANNNLAKLAMNPNNKLNMNTNWSQYGYHPIQRNSNPTLAYSYSDMNNLRKEKAAELHDRGASLTADFRRRISMERQLARAKGATGIASGLMAALTAQKTITVDGETYEMSKGAKGLSQTLSGLSTGLGSMISPMVGMLAGTVANGLIPIFAKAIDGTRIAMEQYRKQVEKNISTLEKVDSSFDRLFETVEKGLLRPEDLRDIEAAKKNIIDVYSLEENADLRKQLIKNYNKISNTNFLSLDEILEQKNISDEDKIDAYYRLMLAQKQLKNSEKQEQYNIELSKLQKEAAENSRAAQDIGESVATTAGVLTAGGIAAGGAGIGAAVGSIIPGLGTVIGAVVGAVAGGVAGAIGGTTIGNAVHDKLLEEIADEKFGNMSISEQIDRIEELLSEGVEINSDSRAALQNSLNNLKSIQAEMIQNRKQLDKMKVEEALLSGQINGQYLGQLSSRQKATYGVDEIFRAIADNLVSNGDLSYNMVYNDKDTKELSAYGKTMIKEVLMANEEYAKILKGELYTLSDINNLPLQGQGLASINNQKRSELYKRYGVETDEALFKTLTTYYNNAKLQSQLDNARDSRDKITATLAEKNAELENYTYEETRENNQYSNAKVPSYISEPYNNLKDEVADLNSQLERINLSIKDTESLSTGNLTFEELKEDMALYNEMVANNSFNREILQNAWAATGATSESEFAEIVKKYGDLTTADFSLTSTQNVEKIKDISSMMSEIASNSKSWSEKTNDIIQKYPSLIKYLNNSDQLQKNLLDRAVQYGELQIRQQFKSIIGNDEYFAESFKKSLESITTASGDSFYKYLSTTYKDFSGVTTLDTLFSWQKKHAVDAADDIDKLNEIIEKEIGATELISDVQKEIRNSIITYQETLMDKQISNLQEQKQALSEITSQREYENKLIEAKLKLENAQKDKKRIWREGVGWVYEADQNTVSEAQKELDELDNKKKISELDVQITQLEADKKMLSDITREEELAEQKALYDAWVRKYNENTGSLNETLSSNIYSALTNENSSLINVALSVEKLIGEWKGKWDKKAEDDETNRKEAWDAFVLAKDNLKEAQEKYAATPNYQNEQKLATARKEYNQALTNWQTAYTNSQNSGYTSSADYTKDYNGEEGSYSKSEANGHLSAQAQQEALHGEQAYDNTEDWWLPTYNVNGTKGFEHYSFNRDNMPPALDDAEIKTLMNDLDAHEWYHEAVMWEDGHMVTPWEAKAKYGGTQVPVDEIKAWDNDIGKFKDWITDKHNNAVVWSKELGGYIRITPNGFYRMTRGGTAVTPSNAGDSAIVYYRGEYINNVPGSAVGSLGVDGGLNLINELGTEAIITPHGTLTALPSKTGIVPADITSNLWQLGELAPSILRSIVGGINNPQFNKNNQSVDESFNINGLTMNITADDTFDINSFVNAIKNQAALTKNK